MAAGKGVILPATTAEAVEAARQIMVDSIFGAVAGAEVVIEEFLEGEEVSLLAFSDGITAVGMPAAQVRHFSKLSVISWGKSISHGYRSDHIFTEPIMKFVKLESRHKSETSHCLCIICTYMIFLAD